MENKQAVMPHKKISYAKIAFTVMLLAIIYWGCNKRDFHVNQAAGQQNGGFYDRDESLFPVFSDINGNRTDHFFLNNIIEGLKRKDADNSIANTVTKNLGDPAWDFSAILKNTNGFRSLATPIVNDKNVVTGMILFSQETVTKVRYQILNRANPQSRLPIYGNKDGTIFTKSSLNGLYHFFDGQTEQAKNAVHKNGNITTNSQQTNSFSLNYFCWNYEWSYSDLTTGEVTVGRSYTQCIYSLIYSSGDGPVNTLDSEDPSGGGGGGSGEGEFDYLNSYYTPNDTIIQHLDSFPCAQKSLKNIYDVNQILEDIAKNVFGVITKFEITFSKNYNMSNTTVGEYHTTYNTYNDFKGVIDLNPKYLSGSQDYIISTILHESVHAYISYLRSQYQIDNDTATFNLLFPVFAKNFVNRQHEEMGANYVRFISCYLQQLNHDLSDETATALAWGGLEGTKLYESLDQTMKTKIAEINNDAYKSTDPTNSRKFKKCN